MTKINLNHIYDIMTTAQQTPERFFDILLLVGNTNKTHPEKGPLNLTGRNTRGRMIGEKKIKSIEGIYSKDYFEDKFILSLAPHLANNTWINFLDLSYQKIGNVGVRALAGALSKNTTLEGLNLNNNEFGDEGLLPLAEALKQNHSLKHLSLQFNRFTDEGLKVLAAALADNSIRLESLRIDDKWEQQDPERPRNITCIYPLDKTPLAAALATNTTLKALHFGGNKISSEAVRSLAQSLLTNSTLNFLDLRANFFKDLSSDAMTSDDNDMGVLAQALLDNQGLQAIDLGNNIFSAKNTQLLATALSKRQQPLAVSFWSSGRHRETVDCLNDFSIVNILQAGSQLTWLDLGSCALQIAEIQLLSTILETNKILQALLLHWNDIDDDHAMVLAKGLETNSALTSLDLHANKIGSTGGVALAKLLMNNSVLQELNLSENQLGSEDNGSCANAFEQALEKNTSLRRLNLTNNKFNHEDRNRLIQCVRVKNSGLAFFKTHHTVDEEVKSILAERTQHLCV